MSSPGARQSGSPKCLARANKPVTAKKQETKTTTKKKKWIYENKRQGRRKKPRGFSVQLFSVMVLRSRGSGDVNVHLFPFQRSSARLLLHFEPNREAGRGQDVGRERDDDSAMFPLKHCLLCNTQTHAHTPPPSPTSPSEDCGCRFGQLS